MSLQQPSSVAWPAIVKYAGAAELTYVASQTIWDADAHLHGARYEQGDVLIDSNGGIYAFLNGPKHLATPIATGQSARLEEVLDMVRAHAAQAGACCVAKFYAASIREAIEAVHILD